MLPDGNSTRYQNMLLKRVVLPCFLLLLVSCTADEPAHTLRFATFNVAMGLEQPGELTENLQSGNDKRLQKLAEIIQRVRPGYW